MKPLQETSNCDPYPCRTLCRSSLKTKTLSTKKKGPWMQAPNRGLTESSGEVFLLDTLSHRMSEMAMLQQLTVGLVSRINSGWTISNGFARM